ncbi:glycosyltransferase family 2 protein [Candidatus Woesearchaeota archaeon]|nr:glycosyltransferase family 2 protein [Candidatus Woesearchaeota archaeon]
MNISIVIPVYNEEKSIKEVIGKIKQAMSSTSHEYEIIAVNDCSTDKSQQILKTIQNIRVINHPINKGYGSSLKTGIKNASYEWIVIMDADGTYPAKSIPKLINGCENYDLVSGKRTGKNTKIPLLRRPAKFMLTYVANFLVGLKIPDLNCGLRLFRKSNVEKYLNILPERF